MKKILSLSILLAILSPSYLAAQEQNQSQEQIQVQIQKQTGAQIKDEIQIAQPTVMVVIEKAEEAAGAVEVEKSGSLEKQVKVRNELNNASEATRNLVQQQVQTAEQQMEIVQNQAGLTDEQLSKAQWQVQLSQKIMETATEQIQAQQEITERVQKVEGRAGWLSFLIGPDYKQLREVEQQVENNRLRVQKLQQYQEQLQNEGEETQLQQTVQALEQQNTALQNQVQEKQNRFSLFGWAAKWLSKYF